MPSIRNKKTGLYWYGKTKYGEHGWCKHFRLVYGKQRTAERALERLVERGIPRENLEIV